RLAKHLALRDEAALLADLGALADPPDVVATTLRYHHLTRSIRAFVPLDALQTALPAGLVDALLRSRPIGRAPINALVAAFDEAQEALAAARVPVLLFKGFYLAERLYGGVDHRPQSDVDLLVHRGDFRRAGRVLRRLGYRVARGDIHSKDLVRGTIKLDLHRFLRWAPALHVDEEALWTSAIETAAAGVTFRTLSDEYTLVALALAAFENLGQGMERLKQLFDLWLLMRALDATFDWEGFLRRREPENLLAIVVNVFAFVVDVFDARGELPRLAQSLAARRELVAIDDRATALALLAAPRKDRDNLLWFGRVYPGSMTLYLAWFWYGGFPANLGRLGPSWLLSHLQLGRDLRGTRRRGMRARR
ncbi:MAG: nucleotidyltransferase family protein, partial [Candidatus Binatia bacterium]